MITSIARQSIMIKCNMQASVLLGNYEFYYAAGLFCKIKGIAVEEDIKPQELKDCIEPELKNFSSEDKREKHLVKMLLHYEILEDYDAQMKELFLMGLNEENFWQL